MWVSHVPALATPGQKKMTAEKYKFYSANILKDLLLEEYTQRHDSKTNTYLYRSQYAPQNITCYHCNERFRFVASWGHHMTSSSCYTATKVSYYFCFILFVFLFVSHQNVMCRVNIASSMILPEMQRILRPLCHQHHCQLLLLFPHRPKM